MKQSVFLHGKQTTGRKSVKLNSACLLVLVYKYGQEKLNNLYYQVKEQRR